MVSYKLSCILWRPGATDEERHGKSFDMIWYEEVSAGFCGGNISTTKSLCSCRRKCRWYVGKHVPVDGCMGRWLRASSRAGSESGTIASSHWRNDILYHNQTLPITAHNTVLQCCLPASALMFFLLPRFVDIRTKLLPCYSIQLQSWVRSSDVKRRQTFEAEAEDNNPRSPQITYNITKYP